MTDRPPSRHPDLVATVVLWVLGAVATVAVAADGQVVEFPTEPTAVVLEYTQTHALLAHNDPQPLLRVYGDGRVAVHVPVYMKAAGDYQMMLEPAALERLMQSVVSAGALDFDDGPEAAEGQAAGAADDTLSISDSSRSRISFDVRRVEAGSATSRARSEPRVLTVENLGVRARHFPDDPALARLAALERSLQALCREAATRPRADR